MAHPMTTDASALAQRVEKTIARNTPTPHRRWKRYSSKTFYLFASPWILGFVILTLFPMIYAFLLSLTNWDGLSLRWKWIGLKNYFTAFHDPMTGLAIGKTLLYTAISVPGSLALGMCLALLLNRRLPGIAVFRTIFYLPAVMPIVASAITWRLILDRDFGALNAFLGFFHLTALNWLDDPWAFFSLLMLTFWSVGSSMIISLAGLQNLPQELQESARLEGANAVQSFFRISLPLLSPVLLFEMVTGIIFAFQVLYQSYALSVTQNGIGVASSIYVYGIHVFNAFTNNQLAYAAALLWILFLLILVVTLVILRFASSFVYYEVERN